MQIDTVVFFQITDPKLYTYGVEHPLSAIENLTATTLRNIIGELELDQHAHDAATPSTPRCAPSWTRPPTRGASRSTAWSSRTSCRRAEIQNAMEKQMKAERETPRVHPAGRGPEAVGQILVAEGEKQSTILRADAEKQAAILKAEAERRGRRSSRPRARPQAILNVQQATADGIRMVRRGRRRQRRCITLQGLRGPEDRRRRSGHEDHHPLRHPGRGRTRRQPEGDRGGQVAIRRAAGRRREPIVPARAGDPSGACILPLLTLGFVDVSRMLLDKGQPKPHNVPTRNFSASRPAPGRVR